jgi:methyl-accepting chemotaxis protein
MLLSLVAVTIVAWSTLNRVEQAAERTATRFAPQLNRISDVQVLMFRLSLEARHAMLATSPQELDETLQRIGSLRKTMVDHLQAFEEDLSTEGGKARFARIREADAVFWRLGGEVLGKVQAGNVDAAFDQLKRELVPARDIMVAAIADQGAWQQEIMLAAVEEAKRAADRTKTVVLVLSLLTFALALWIAFSLIRMITGAFARARAITERIAGGDLAFDFYVKPGDEFGHLFASLAHMKQRLRDVLASVREASVQVGSASHQVDHACRDLSAGVRSQAGSLADTSKATVRMADAVAGSVGRIERVSGLAAEASRVATDGGAVVTQVVDTMERIDESSRQIAEIVNVIDGIAFQTNILALNAAVEAARAGEQGRGFAVVASEVRNLAQRSAAAAREVKALIAESATRVESGSRLVQQAGQTMTSIVTSVQQVTDLMSDIAAAAREQNASVEDVNRAMHEIDQRAQHSAGLVEHASDGAATLRTQAEALQAAVARFRLVPQDPAVTTGPQTAGAQAALAPRLQPA